MLDQAATQLEPKMVPIESIRFVKELYPRLKPHDEVIQRYRNAIDKLPPIMVARDGVLVDGYHRWQAHVREERQTIGTVNLGNLADVEIWRASIEANSIHGEQLSVAEKKKEAIKGWGMQAHLPIVERIADLAKLFGVSRRAVELWTKDARAEEKCAVQDRAYDLWLDCHSQRDIAEIIGKEYPAFAGTDHATVLRWIGGAKSKDFGNAPPDSRHTSIFGNSRRLTKMPAANPTLAPCRRRWWRICCGSLRNPATSLSIRLPVPVPLWMWRRRWGGVSGRRTFAAITIHLICRSTSMILPLAGLMLHPGRPISYSLIRLIGNRRPVAIQQNPTSWRKWIWPLSMTPGRK